MATRKTVVLVCDLCAGEDLVGTHQLAVDGKAVEFDACPSCWQDVVSSFAGIAKVGRALKAKRVAKKDVMPFPGVAWEFTAHALIRMGERHITAEEAAKAAEQPELTRPGRDANSEVRVLRNVKVVVVPKRHLVLTVSRPDEE